jgi:hypothetical protein
MIKSKNLILIELNEISFDIVKKYIERDPKAFPSLKRLLAEKMLLTTAESDYDKLEPWIQWVSVHTGLKFSEHKIFRLGDIIGSRIPQIHEHLETNGVAVGCISPMNTENRLQNPCYFIPDPWTKTLPDKSWWSRKLHQVITQTVNDNAQSKVTAKSVIILFLGLIKYGRILNCLAYCRLLVGSVSSPWNKALFLDLFLHDIHITLFKAHRPGFSSVFLNAGAHIQHHYFLNAKVLPPNHKVKNPESYLRSEKDPVRDAYALYDRIIGQYFKMEGVDLIIATGLSQKPYDRLKYYYRLKNHQQFLTEIGIADAVVYPRMTRDFLIKFNNKESLNIAANKLKKIVVLSDGLQLFGEIEVRDLSLFVTLTYPNRIDERSTASLDGVKIDIYNKLVFVALKNGMHSPVGYAFFTDGVASYAPENMAHVCELYKTVKSYHGV